MTDRERAKGELMAIAEESIDRALADGEAAGYDGLWRTQSNEHHLRHALDHVRPKEEHTDEEEQLG